CSKNARTEVDLVITLRMEFKISYFKEVFKELVNIGGLLLSVAAAVYSATTGFIEPTLVLAGALVLEGVYLATVPASTFYRRVVDRRSRHLLEEPRRKQREELIKTFDPREREAVDYLSWMKKQIRDNYKKFARLTEELLQLRELESTWEAFP